MKYEAIGKYSQEFSVRKMCTVLGLAPQAYYQWRRREAKRREKQAGEKELVEQIREVFEANQRVYGYRTMQHALAKQGIELSEYKVRRMMRENGLYPVSLAMYKPSRKGTSSGQFFADSVQQAFNPQAPNEVWAGDITYIRTSLGWVYLAVVIELFNREVIGYSVSKNIDTELVKRALGNALINSGGGGQNTIFHSDRGIQYSSKTFQAMLAQNGLVGSMSKAGCPYDNAPVEGFFSIAKRECLYRKKYDNMDEVERDLFAYIELFYNRRRMRKGLGYLSPVDYRLTKASSVALENR